MKFKIYILVGLIIIISGFVWHKILGYGLGFNVSDSMPPGLYLSNKNTEKISNGDIIGFCASDKIYDLFISRGYINSKNGICKNDNPAFIKKVIAQQGDLVEVKNNKLYVNSIEIPNSTIFDNDKKGRRLDHLQNGYSHVLLRSELFAFGDNNIRSLDSRYIGLIKKDEILFKAKMLYKVSQK